MDSQFLIPVLSNLCSEPVGIKIFEILVQDPDNGDSSSIAFRVKYLFVFYSDIVNFVWKTYEGETKTILLIF